MRSVNLLVTDRSPESAEHINSTLRNSGINIHVIHVQSCADANRAIEQDQPILIIYADADETDAPIGEISTLADAAGIPLAILANLDEIDRVSQFLQQTACLVIDAGNEELLSRAVTALLKRATAERNSLAQERHMEELKHRYDLLLESARDPIAYIHEGLHVYANRAYRDALRISDDAELAGISLLEMFDAGKTDLKSLLKGLAKGTFLADPLDVQVKRPDGTQFEASLLFSPAQYDGEQCTQMMMQRKDAVNELTAELERLRFTDPLTRLHNRKSFIDELEAWISGNRGEGTAAVLYLEPDGFDELHDELGVDTVDAFITDLAEVIRHCVGDGDVAARINDRGFAVLAHRTTLAELEALAERMLGACRGHIVELDSRSVSMSCSIGLSSVGRVVVNSSEIIAAARKAQAEAATHGDQIVVYRPQLTAVASGDDDQQWIERIRHALSQEDFYSVQQTIVDLDGDGAQMVENSTFMRSDGVDHGPTEYLHVADANDLGSAIDRQILPGLLQSLAESEERQIINISANSVLDYAFPGWLAEQIESLCADGSKLVLQISAQAALNNLRPAQRLIKELAPLGCRLAINQFDADRRTCQLLEHLDLEFIKLRSDMTDGLLANDKQRETIRKIVEAAEPHGVEVVADEVADTSSLAVLWQCGVRMIAGTFLQETTQVLAQ